MAVCRSYLRWRVLNEDIAGRDLQKNRKCGILKQYKRLLELDEVKLEFDDDALRSIAKKSAGKDTGARALRSIIEDFMLDIMYEIPKDSSIGEVIITKDYIEKDRRADDSPARLGSSKVRAEIR